MSMPSDVTSDVGDTMGQRKPRPLARTSRSLLRDVTPEQLGVAAAALVAFVGVSVLGPRIAELRRSPTLSERAQLRARDARRRASEAGQRTQKRLRQLGGGAIRR